MTRRQCAIPFVAICTCITVATTGCEDDENDNGNRSPNGQYEAITVSIPDGSTHYQVIDVQTHAVKLTTTAQYSTANDVKDGAFSADSTRFAAAYYYSHAGLYTWVGIWNVESGDRIDVRTFDGWVGIPEDVFN